VHSVSDYWVQPLMAAAAGYLEASKLAAAAGRSVDPNNCSA